MQVFTTSPDLYISAQQLDSRRANKQIMECNQIYKAAIGETKGWKNHCVTRLWENDLKGLMWFAWACYFKLIDEGKHPMAPCTKRVDGVNVASMAANGIQDLSSLTPSFLNLKWVTDAMKSHLLNKDEAFYSKFKWDVEKVPGYYAINKDGNWQKYSFIKVK